MAKRKTKAKPASEAQKRARERNWNKAQIKNTIATAHRIYNSKTTHKKEKTDLGIIIDAASNILHNWGLEL